MAYKAMTNEVGGSFDALSFTPGAVVGYVITCADSSGSFEWSDPTGFSVTSVQGTNRQVYANGTYGSQQIGDIILTLPQDIAIDSQPQFSRIFIKNNSLDTYLQIYNISGNNYQLFYRDKILTTFEVAGQIAYYGLNSASAAYTLMTHYTYCNSNTAGAETATTLWESIENGSQLPIFGFIGNNVYYPQLTANSYAYLNSNKYLTARSATDFKNDVLSFFSATLPVVDTSGVFSLNYGGNLRLNGSNLDTVTNPTFSNATFSGISASQYVKTDALKALTTVATIPASDITGLSANLPVVYAAGTISLNYTSNLQLSGSSLDTIQDIKTSSTPTFVNVELTGLTASQYAKTDSKKNFTTVATIPFSDITGFNVANPLLYSGGVLYLNYGYNFSLAGSALTTAQDIITGASPQWVNLTLTGLTASNYVKTNGSKLLVSVASIPASDITGLSGTAPITYAAGAIGINYTGNLQNSAGSLNTIQDIKTSSSPQFTDLTLSGLTASNYVKTNGSKLLVSASSIPASDITGLSATLPIVYSGGTTSLNYSSNLRLNGSNLDTIQDIKTSSSPQFLSTYLKNVGAASNTIFEQDNDVNGYTNYQLIFKYRTGGLTPFQTISQWVSYGENSTGGLYGAYTTYTYNNISTTGTEMASTIFESASGGSTLPVMGFIGHALQMPRVTASSMLCLDSNQYVQPTTLSPSLTFSGTTLSTAQDIRTSASPSFTGCNLSSLTASTYLYADGSKNITSRSTANFAADVVTYATAGLPTLDYNSYVFNVTSISGFGSVSNKVGNYLRVGNMVQFSGYFQCTSDNTTASLTSEIDIPIPNSGAWTNNFQANGSCTGVANIGAVNEYTAGTTTSINTNKVVLFNKFSATPGLGNVCSFRFSIMYLLT